MNRELVEKVLMISEKLEHDEDLESIMMLAIELSETMDITLAANKTAELMDAVEQMAVNSFKRVVQNMDYAMASRLSNARVIAQGGL